MQQSLGLIMAPVSQLHLRSSSENSYMTILALKPDFFGQSQIFHWLL
ncbi:hypothetical protein VCRA2120O332_20278 [Vibrio crassostreae]|nr:hypothetical protein VCRA2120O332_20278 [Vibrio crassostreae]